jgi:hypothetical protein
LVELSAEYWAEQSVDKSVDYLAVVKVAKRGGSTADTKVAGKAVL